MGGVELLLTQLRAGERTVFAKVLAHNDHSWADDRAKHQSGPYIPASLRESGFFPKLAQRSDKPHIYEIVFPVAWPQAPTHPKEARLAHFSNKGPETHFTRVPKELFQNLGPASLFVAIKTKPHGATRHGYACFVFDSNSEDYDIAFDILGIPPSFEAGFVQVDDEPGPEAKLIALILEALEQGRLDRFIVESALPSGQAMAISAQTLLRSRHDIKGLNPYEDLAEPGDALIELTEIEYADFRARELRLRASQVAEIFARRSGAKSKEHLIAAIVTGFAEISDLFKSIRGARASRAGTSFELHIRQMLIDGAVPFDYQQLIGSRSPDFILPSLGLYKSARRRQGDVMILSAKTTLRERWQQILNEGAKSAAVFLATLDQTVTQTTLRDLAGSDIHLVVPERYVRHAGKGHQTGVYFNQENVISFRSFFDDVIGSRRHGWMVK